ncbi:MAG: hypothetical protein ACE5JP_16635 [Candidatus Bipolaricaulia bacterium]
MERFNRRLQEQRMGGKTDRNMEEFDGPEVTVLTSTLGSSTFTVRPRPAGRLAGLRRAR